MKTFLFFLTIILFNINLAKNNRKRKKRKERKVQQEKKDNSTLRRPPPFLTFETNIPEDTYHLPNNNVYLLNDRTFDKVLQNGNNYKWLVILFSETCMHCYFARTEIRKIVPEYKSSETVRFAEIEINFNPMTNLRFNIDGVPHIFILRYGVMYIFDMYPSQKNLKQFLERNLADFSSEEKKRFPPQPRFKDNLNFDHITNVVNIFLSEHGIKISFTPITLLIFFISLITLFCSLSYFLCQEFNSEQEEENKEEQKNNKEKEKVKEKIN